MATYARGFDRFTELGASIVGVSVDDPVRNAAMVAKLLLPFPLLSDPDGSAASAWGIYDEAQRIAIPSIFVVHADATVAYRYVGDDFADRPGDDDVLRAVRGGADGSR